MKTKIYNIFAVIVAVAMLYNSASCTKQEISVDTAGGNITISATMEIPISDTKTSLSEDNTVKWSVGDKISVFFGENTSNTQFTLSAGDGTTSALFTGTAPDPMPSTIYAVYPYNNATLFYGRMVILTLPGTQTYREGGFAEGMNPAVAYTTTGGNLTFKNLCGILKLQLKVESGTKTIKKITVFSADSKLSGIFGVNMGEGTPTLFTSDDASNSVSLDLGTSGVELTTTSKTFYIVVPSTTKSSGSYSVTVYDSEGKTMTKSTSSTINRSTIRPMPEISFSTDPISTDNVTSITTTSAISGGEVASDGESTITIRGIVWSTSPNPTIALSTKTEDGSGAGTFTSNITGLEHGSTYYVRAYATNSSNVTYYGEQKRFVTPYKIFTIGGISFGMMYVKDGSFTMGATSEQGSEYGANELPIHEVELNEYYIGQYEVTQGLWKAVMGSDNNPSKNKGDNLPVTNVSWDQCNEFISGLNSLFENELSTMAGQFSLPTEAQWEYAARGGLSTLGYKYPGSNNIEEVAWYKGNSSKVTHPVGTKAPNELGIYDMSGNVWEWCWDWYDANYYSSSISGDPTGPNNGDKKVIRGNGKDNDANDCRISYRASNSTNYPGDSNGGFRIVIKRVYS